jgi:hypothetical protein
LNTETAGLLEPLTAEEVGRGWVEFHCDAHGGLTAAPAGCAVWCRCGKRGRAVRLGRPLPDTRRGRVAHREPVEAALAEDDVMADPVLAAKCRTRPSKSRLHQNKRPEKQSVSVR